MAGACGESAAPSSGDGNASDRNANSAVQLQLRPIGAARAQPHHFRLLRFPPGLTGLTLEVLLEHPAVQRGRLRPWSEALAPIHLPHQAAGDDLRWMVIAYARQSLQGFALISADLEEIVLGASAPLVPVAAGQPLEIALPLRPPLRLLPATGRPPPPGGSRFSLRVQPAEGHARKALGRWRAAGADAATGTALPLLSPLWSEAVITLVFLRDPLPQTQRREARLAAKSDADGHLFFQVDAFPAEAPLRVKLAGASPPGAPWRAAGLAMTTPAGEAGVVDLTPWIGSDSAPGAGPGSAPGAGRDSVYLPALSKGDYFLRVWVGDHPYSARFHHPPAQVQAAPPPIGVHARVPELKLHPEGAPVPRTLLLQGTEELPGWDPDSADEDPAPEPLQVELEVNHRGMLLTTTTAASARSEVLLPADLPIHLQGSASAHDSDTGITTVWLFRPAAPQGEALVLAVGETSAMVDGPEEETDYQLRLRRIHGGPAFPPTQIQVDPRDFTRQDWWGVPFRGSLEIHGLPEGEYDAEVWGLDDLTGKFDQLDFTVLIAD